MPLDQHKSDAARSRNIATEIKAGKPPAQAEAIAYRIQRAKFGDVVGIHTQSRMPIIKSLHGAIEAHPDGLNDEQHAQYRAFCNGGVAAYAEGGVEEPEPADPLADAPYEAEGNAPTAGASEFPSARGRAAPFPIGRGPTLTEYETPGSMASAPDTLPVGTGPTAQDYEARDSEAGFPGSLGVMTSGLQRMAQIAIPQRPDKLNPTVDPLATDLGTAGGGVDTTAIEGDPNTDKPWDAPNPDVLADKGGRGVVRPAEAEVPEGYLGPGASPEDVQRLANPNIDVANTEPEDRTEPMDLGEPKLEPKSKPFTVMDADGNEFEPHESMLTDEQRAARPVAAPAPRTDYANAVAQVESGGGKYMKNPNPGSTSKGLYGFTDTTAKAIDRKYGLDPNDPDIENRRLAALTQENSKKLGTTDPAKLYAAHNSGAAAVQKAVKEATAAGAPDDWIKHLITPTGPGNQDPMQGQKALKRFLKLYQIKNHAVDGAVLEPVPLVGLPDPIAPPLPSRADWQENVPETPVDADVHSDALEAERKQAQATADITEPTGGVPTGPDQNYTLAPAETAQPETATSEGATAAETTTPPTPEQQLEDLVGKAEAPEDIGTELGMRGALNKAGAEAAKGQSLEPIYQNAAEQYAESNQRIQASAQQAQFDANQASTGYRQQLDRLQSMKVDPSAYWHSLDAFHQTLGYLGVLFSGLSGSDHNAALDGINKNIDRNIDAQKFNVGTQKDIATGYSNLYDMALKTFKVPEAAEQATRAGMLMQTANEADAMGAHYAGSIAGAQAQTDVGTLLRTQAEASMKLAEQAYQTDALRRAAVQDIYLKAGQAGLYGAGGPPAAGTPEHAALVRNAVQQGNYLPSPSGDVITKRKPSETELAQSSQLDIAEDALNQLKTLSAKGSKLSPEDKAHALALAKQLGPLLNEAIGLKGGILGQRTEETYGRSFAQDPLSWNPLSRSNFAGQALADMDQIRIARSRLGGGALFATSPGTAPPIFKYAGPKRTTARR